MGRHATAQRHGWIPDLTSRTVTCSTAISISGSITRWTGHIDHHAAMYFFCVVIFRCLPPVHSPSGHNSPGGLRAQAFKGLGFDRTTPRRCRATASDRKARRGERFAAEFITFSWRLILMARRRGGGATMPTWGAGSRADGGNRERSDLSSRPANSSMKPETITKARRTVGDRITHNRQKTGFKSAPSTARRYAPGSRLAAARIAFTPDRSGPPLRFSPAIIYCGSGPGKWRARLVVKE